MLRAKNITFYKIMTAGYITAEAYSAIKPKVYNDEFTYWQCTNYPSSITKELIHFINDNVVQERIYMLEQLNEMLSLGKDAPILLLDELLKNAKINVIETIKRIGGKIFLKDYVYSSSDSLSSRYYIDSNNISSISEFISQYEDAFKYMLNAGKKRTISQIINTTLDDNRETINPGSGFNGIDIISLDNDAVFENSPDNLRYVLYMYELNSQEFDLFRQYLLDQISHMSIRITNALKNICGIRNFYVNYLYAHDKKMYNIRRIGKKSIDNFNKTIKEHIQVFVRQKYNLSDTSAIDAIVGYINNKESYMLKNTIGELKYSILTQELYTLIEHLDDTRAINVIKNYSGDFLQDFVYENKDIAALANIGKKTAAKIRPVIMKLKFMICNLSVRKIGPDELFLMDRRLLYGDCIDDFSKDYMKEHGNLPMFHILENFFRIMLRERNMQILHQFSPIFEKCEKQTFEQIAVKNKLSRERVRQICLKQIKKLQYKEDDINASELNYSKLLFHAEDWEYVVSLFKEAALIKESDIDEFIKVEECKLRKNIAFFSIYTLLCNKYDIIGLDLFLLPSKTKALWHNSYMIRKDITACFDFDKLIKLIKNWEERETESLTLKVSELLLKVDFISAWKSLDVIKLNDIEYIVTKMLIQEFGKMPDNQFRFILNGNKAIKSTDIIYNILKGNGSPMSVDEIYNASDILKARYKSSNNIKTLVTKDYRTCMVGMRSLAALVEWNIKLGGIRNLISEYLSKCAEPQPIENIIRYVQQYRESKAKNISSSMNCKRYKRYPGGLWGLANKKYAHNHL